MPYLMAIDAGTAGAKALLFDASGRRRASHHEPWSYLVRPCQAVPFSLEMSFDADKFWGLVVRCAREAIARSGVRASEIAGCAVTAQRVGCVFLDPAGREVYAGPNADGRGVAAGVEIIEQVGVERGHRITGHWPPFVFVAARYRAWRQAGGGEVAHILTINDWITYRLTGECVSEPSGAGDTMCLDVAARTWAGDLCAELGVPLEALPPLREPGTLAGRVRAEAAALTGLQEGTPVYAGGGDTQCALLGSGAVAAGTVGVVMGTTMPVQMVTEGARFDPAGRLWTGCHVVPGRWVLESNAGDAGSVHRWLVEMLVGEEGDPDGWFARAEDLLGRGGAVSEAAETYALLGPGVFDLLNFNPQRPVGILFRLPLMVHRPGPAEILRAFVDSVGFAVRANWEQIGEVSPVDSPRFVLSGGMAHSPAICQAVSDVLGSEVAVAAERDSAGLGCAILAAVGSGLVPDHGEGARRLVRHSVVVPDPGRHERLSERYWRWRELGRTLDQLQL